MENEQKTAEGKEPLMNVFEPKDGSFLSSKLLVILLIVAVIGAGSGYLLSKKGNIVGGNTKSTQNSGLSDTSSGTIIGSDDTKTFKDVAEGVLKEGGIDGEGQFHLERPGGESQNVYLTSSIVDLSQFLGKKVKIWGQTNKAQHAGWLMDAGRLEVL